MVDVQRVLRRLGIEGDVYGDHLVAICPFHGGKKPHWRVRLRGERRGLHWCFSCQEGGDLYDLVMQVRDYGTRAAAVGWVEEHFGAATEEDLAIPTIEMVTGFAQRRTLRMPAGVTIGEPLEVWPTLVREYLELRGITRAQVTRWGIGYAVDGRLHGRIVIPIRDVYGELASYVGRAWHEMPKRFLYPREEEGQDLEVLFGEQYWPRPIQMRGDVVVTEGAIKSLAVERVFPAVCQAAIGGSDVRLMHVTKLGTFRRVVVLTDADPAGERAGFELQAALAGTTRVERVRLPPGQDADKLPPQELKERLWGCLT